MLLRCLQIYICCLQKTEINQKSFELAQQHHVELMIVSYCSRFFSVMNHISQFHKHRNCFVYLVVFLSIVIFFLCFFVCFFFQMFWIFLLINANVVPLHNIFSFFFLWSNCITLCKATSNM